MNRNRRGFLQDVGSGMVIASVGAGLASDLGCSSAFADEDEKKLSFGEREPLVELMQQTPVDKLQPLLVNMLKDGSADLRQLMTAGALANARTFGGEVYVGFHTMMALVPALEMSGELPKTQQALPVLKVLYRNTAQIQARGGRNKEVLQPVEPAKLPGGKPGGVLLRNAVDVAGSTPKWSSLRQTGRRAAPQRRSRTKGRSGRGHLRYALERVVAQRGL